MPRTDEPDRYVEMVKARDIVVQRRPPLPRRHSGTKIRGTLKDAPSRSPDPCRTRRRSVEAQGPTHGRPAPVRADEEGYLYEGL